MAEEFDLIQIKDFNAASSASNNDFLPVYQSGVTRKIGLNILANAIISINGIIKETDVINNLNSNIQNKPVSAYQANLLKQMIDNKIDINKIIDNLTTNSDQFVLSARQGKVLYDLIESFSSQIGSGIIGEAIPSTVPISEGFGIYTTSTAGIYDNFLDSLGAPIEVTQPDLDSGLVQLWGNNNVWDKQVTAINFKESEFTNNLESSNVLVKDDVIFNLLDSNSGYEVTLKRQSAFPDGSLITEDDTTDNNIIFQLPSSKGGGFGVRTFDVGQSRDLVVDTIQDMRSMSKSDLLMFKLGIYDFVELQGYYAKGDTPSPIKYQLSTTEDEDDGGSVIDVSGLKFIHEFVDILDVSYYGVSSTVLNNTPLINKAIDYASLNNIPRVVNYGNIFVSVVEEAIPTDYSNAINLKSNIHFENYGTIKLNPTNIERTAIISCLNISNFSIRVGLIEGDKLTHLGTTGEWGMGIRLYSCRKYSIINGSIKTCWGDGIILTAGASSSQYNEGCFNGLIGNLTLDNNRRQGITVGCANKLLIDNCLLINTGGTLPQSGIDIEPNNNQNCRNIVLSNIKASDNLGSQLVISALALNANVDGVSIENCDIAGRVHISSSNEEPTAVVQNIGLRKCKISSLNQSGINIINGVKSVDISDCDIYTIKNDGLPDAYAAIRIFKSSNCKARFNRLSSDKTADGVSITDISQNHDISDNTINNVLRGVANTSNNSIFSKNIILNAVEGVINYGNNNSFSKNIIDDVSISGIRIASGSGNKVSFNEVSGIVDTTYGIRVDSTGTNNETISNNVIDVINGIINISSNSKILSNTIKNCSLDALTNYANFCHISDNDTINTGRYGIAQNGGQGNIIKANILTDSATLQADNTSRALYISNSATGNTIIFNTLHNNNAVVKPTYGIEDAPGTTNNIVGWNNINDNFYTKVRNLIGNKVVLDVSSDFVANVSTADATDLPTALSLVNTLKGRLNDFFTKDKANGYMKKS